MSGATCVVLLYPGCTIAEVIDAATRLRSGEVNVQFVSVDGADVIDQSGLIMVPDRPIDEIDRKRVDAVVVPGGDPEAIVGDAAVHALLQAVATGGGVLAAICAVVLVLGDAGLLVDRHITHNYRSPWAASDVAEFVAPLLDGATIEPAVGDAVCVDASNDPIVITALPNATVEFTSAVCQALGVYDGETAELLERHLHGEFVPELFESD